MAILIDCEETIIGIPMTDTYARIVSFQGDKNYVMLTVEHYANEKARMSNAQPLAMRTLTGPTDAFTEGFQGLYKWLKEQPEYANGKDC